MHTSVAFGLSVLLCACGPSLAPDAGDAASQADRQLGGLAKDATGAIDPSRCTKADERLRPFVLSWDATTQAEFEAHAQSSLLLVKLDGCDLELVPQCRLPGEYRMQQTAGGLQEMFISSEAELYAKLTFSVASLSGELARSKSISASYFVRGLRSATAPAIYRRDLPATCASATHFVASYAAGAYQLASKAGQSAGGSVEVAGQGAGAKAGESASVLFRGGAMAACEAGGAECQAPVRLRLLPITEVEIPAGERAAHQLALTKPEVGTTPIRLTPAQLLPTLNVGRRALKLCVAAWSKDEKPQGTLRFVLDIGGDGVVKTATLKPTDDATPLSDTLRECAQQALLGLRFPSSRDGTKLSNSIPLGD